MGSLDIIIDDRMREKATNKCNEIIDSLSECSIEEKTFILHQLVQSFKDITKIDICRFAEISQEENKDE